MDPSSDTASSKSIPLKIPAPELGLYRPDVDTSHISEKKLLRKVDLHIVPWLALLYLLSFMDRGTIGNARLYSLERDIHIIDQQYINALMVFFFPYALLEPASNVLLKRFKPRITLSVMILAWGTVTTLHGIVNNYAGLLAVRIFLGVFEAGLYPGIVFYISTYYTRKQVGQRLALFFSSATVAGSLSGLLAAAISKMDGVGGLAGWRWIFILEGLLTVVAGLASPFIIQDFPDTATFLKEDERVFLIRGLQADQQYSAAGERFNTRYIWQSLKDPKTYVAMALYMGFDGPLYAFSLFLPTIISQLGYRATVANLLSVPVYAWGCVVIIIVGIAGDRYGNRSYFNIGLFLTGLAAYIILTISTTPALSYFAVYLAASAIYASIPNSVAWVAGNVEGSYKRSVTLGMAIGFGNLNGAVTCNIYRAKHRPWYRMGHSIVLAYICVALISTVLLRILLQRENARRDRGEKDEVIRGVDNPNANSANGTYDSPEDARADKGDEWSGFRYSL